MALVQPWEVNPSAGQNEYGTLETLFSSLDLSLAEELVRGCFHVSGQGRPPRNPLGLFRTFVVVRMRGVRSLRETARLLNADRGMRKLCLFEEGARGYPRSVLSRFTKRVGADRLERIVEEKVAKLLKGSKAEEVDALLDTSFMKA